MEKTVAVSNRFRPANVIGIERPIAAHGPTSIAGKYHHPSGSGSRNGNVT